MIAAAVAGLFVTAGASLAGDTAASAGKTVVCSGINACKGHGACKGADHECAGKNGCKGKGIEKVASAKECTDRGGKVVE